MRDAIEVKSLKPRKNKVEAKKAEIKQMHNFYRIKWKHDKDSDENTFQGIIIEKIQFLEKLKSFGFYIYEIGVDHIKYVLIKDNVVTEISRRNMMNIFLKWVKQLPTYEHEEQSFSITANQVEKKIIDSLEILFKPIYLGLLEPPVPIKMKEDEIDCKFFFFKNGFVKVGAKKTEFLDYSKLNSMIWTNQILKRIYEKSDQKESVFEKFCKRVAGYRHESDADFDPESYSQEEFEQRYESLKTIIGYNLHNFSEGKRFATIFTDSAIGDDGEANGRTGKTLFSKALGQILNTDNESTVYCEISGRKFKLDDKHRYEKCNLDTKLIHLNDMFNHFNLENIFTDITEGVESKRMYQSPIYINPKIVISTNKTIKIDGESSLDRVVQFEFSSFFNSKLSPLDYYGHWFFRDWDQKEWHRFDDFIISCCQVYFEKGLVKPKEINLKRRSIIDHTNLDFIRWLEDKLPDKNPEVAITDQILIAEPGEEPKRYAKKELYDEFLVQYPDFKVEKWFNQARLTRWFKFYFKNSYDDVELMEQRSSGVDYFIFYKSRIVNV